MKDIDEIMLINIARIAWTTRYGYGSFFLGFADNILDMSCVKARKKVDTALHIQGWSKRGH